MLEKLEELYLTYQSTLGYIGINALLGLSVYTTLSCGQLALSSAGFMAIGAYAATLLTLNAHVPFSGAQGIVAIPQLTSLFTIYLSLAIALLLLWRLRGSKWGFALEAIREDEAAARTMGIHTTAYKLAMLVLGAALAGLAGGLEAHFTFMVAPNGFGFSRVVDMLVFAVVGGTAAFYGPVVGATFLTLLPEVLREIAPLLGIEPGPLRFLVNGVVLLAVILFLPNGIVSLPRRLRESRRARSATA